MLLFCENCGYINNIKIGKGMKIKETICPKCNKKNFKKVPLNSIIAETWVYFNKPDKITQEMIKKYKQIKPIVRLNETMIDIKDTLENLIKYKNILEEQKMDTFDIQKEILYLNELYNYPYKDYKTLDKKFLEFFNELNNKYPYLEFVL